MPCKPASRRFLVSLAGRLRTLANGYGENKKHRNTSVPAPLGIEPNTNLTSPPNIWLRSTVDLRFLYGFFK